MCDNTVMMTCQLAKYFGHCHSWSWNLRGYQLLTFVILRNVVWWDSIQTFSTKLYIAYLVLFPVITHRNCGPIKTSTIFHFMMIICMLSLEKYLFFFSLYWNRIEQLIALFYVLKLCCHQRKFILSDFDGFLALEHNNIKISKLSKLGQFFFRLYQSCVCCIWLLAS